MAADPLDNGSIEIRPGRVKTLPKTSAQVSFDNVVKELRGGQPATAFIKASETLLENFNALKGEMTAVGVLKLAIEMHKHGLFCEVAQDKARTEHDKVAYDKFQEYLNGSTDIPVASGLPTEATVKANKFDVDLEASDGQDAEG